MHVSEHARNQWGAHFKLVHFTVYKTPIKLPLKHGKMEREVWIYFLVFKKNKTSCRDGAVAKSTSCFCKGSRFNFQHTHGGSQLSVTPNSRGSDALFWLWWAAGMHVVCIHKCWQNHIKNLKKNKYLKKSHSDFASSLSLKNFKS